LTKTWIILAVNANEQEKYVRFSPTPAETAKSKSFKYLTPLKKK